MGYDYFTPNGRCPLEQEVFLLKKNVSMDVSKGVFGMFWTMNALKP
jgi:hypothetical protein